MNHQIKYGTNIIEVNDHGEIVSTRTGENRMSLRPDDGIPGKLPVTCANGHEGFVEVPAVVASVTGKSFAIESSCPLCGGKLSAPEGYYARKEGGLFERLSGMPS